MEVLEAREALADPATPVAAVDTLQRGVQATILRLVSDITKAFAGKDLARARDATVALQYYTKLRDEVEEWRAASRPAPPPPPPPPKPAAVASAGAAAAAATAAAPPAGDSAKGDACGPNCGHAHHHHPHRPS